MGQMHLAGEKYNGIVETNERYTPITKDLLPDFSIMDPIDVQAVAVAVAQSNRRRARKVRELQDALNLDPFLEIRNRKFFDKSIETLILTQTMRRGEEAKGFSLILIDIDHFKSINDDYGHLQGDSVLKQMVRLLNNQLRENDILCRYGGEEFGILMPGRLYRSALSVADRLRLAIDRNMFLVSEGEIKLTISLGVGDFNCGKDSFSGEELIRNVDRALYLAKDEGRNRIAYFDKSISEPKIYRSLRRAA